MMHRWSVLIIFLSIAASLYSPISKANPDDPEDASGSCLTYLFSGLDMAPNHCPLSSTLWTYSIHSNGPNSLSMKKSGWMPMPSIG
jgi:hypothetical protein